MENAVDIAPFGGDDDAPDDSISVDFSNITEYKEIYTSFINKAILEDRDREELKRERGFSDEVINLCHFKSCRPENKKIIEDLTHQYGEDILLDSGLLEAKDQGIVPCTQLLGRYKNKVFSNNICIPYFDSDGDIFFIRPHKFGLKGKQIQVYCATQNVVEDKIWIITESEFKAVAAMQYGYPAIGLPGIHSFVVKHFFRLKDFIVKMNIKRIVIIYDNEIKTNPKFKNYKPNVIKQWDTQWRAVDLCRKLAKALSQLSDIKIGVLPSSWMEEGKIDIDGALAQKRTPDEFKAIIYRAVDWQKYVTTLPKVAKQIINRRVYKEDYLEESKIKKKEDGYFVTKSKKVGPDYHEVSERITNFTLEIRKTLVEGDTHIREVVFRGQDGSMSKPHICKVGTNILREFKTWAWSCGDYHYTGKQEDLDLIWKLEGAICDGREILRPEQIGFLKEGEGKRWLFGNCLINENGTVLLPDKEGIIWEGLTGYLPKSIVQEGSKNTGHAKMPMINLNNPEFGLTQLKAVVRDMEIVFGTKAIRLAVGWMIACLFSDEIYKKYACFPILFIGGKRECGKTTLGNWLMAMMGLNSTAGDGLTTSTSAGVMRNLSWFCNIAYWLDEYRNNQKIKRQWVGPLRNIYQRQSQSKGTLGSGIRSHTINAGVILSGEETPQDNALLSRCLQINLVKNRDEDHIDIYRNIEELRSKNLLSKLIPEVIKVKSSLLPIILDHIDGWKKRLIEEGAGERIALNNAIAAVCYDMVFLRDEPLPVRKEFTRWVIEEAYRTEIEKESEHMLSVFMDGLVAIQDKLEEHYVVFEQNKETKGRKRIAIHFPTFYSHWVADYRRQGNEQFKAATMMSYIREEPYFISDKNSKRVHGRTHKCVYLSLDACDNPPDGLIYLAGSAIDDIPGAIKELASDDPEENPMF